MTDVTDMANVILVSLFLTLNIFQTFSSVSAIYFDQVNICWVDYFWFDISTVLHPFSVLMR